MLASSRKKELSVLVRLAIPVFLAQIAQVSMGFVDTVMAGGASSTDMAGVAVASGFWMPATLFGQGLLMSITPLVAQSLGAGQREGLGTYVRQGLWFSLGVDVLLMSVLLGLAFSLPLLRNLDAHLMAVTTGYLKVVVWGVPGLMFYCVFRCFQEGHGRTRPAMLAGFVGLSLNIPLNYVFVYGKFGLPAMGGVGCGVATAIVCWVMAFIMFLSVRRSSPQVFRMERVRFEVLARVLRIGTPGAFALLVETSVFGLIAMLIAPLGPIMVAGHQVAMSVGGMMFMVPLSLGSATSIRVGTCLGEGNLPGARTVRQVSVLLTFSLALAMSAFILLFRYPIASIYTNDAQVILLGGSLMFYAGLYQCSDAVQASALATLRGYNDTRAIFFIAFFAYWIITLPLGYTLGMTDFLVPALGVIGFWLALIIGLTLAATLMLCRVRYLESLTLAQVKAKISR